MCFVIIRPQFPQYTLQRERERTNFWPEDTQKDGFHDLYLYQILKEQIWKSSYFAETSISACRFEFLSLDRISVSDQHLLQYYTDPGPYFSPCGFGSRVRVCIHMWGLGGGGGGGSENKPKNTCTSNFLKLYFCFHFCMAELA